MAGIYIHIPFCRKACHYCNFHFSTSFQKKEELVRSIVKELELQSAYLEGQEIGTIYFGGGTPSAIPVTDIQFILETIRKNFVVSTNTEITLEANPDDIRMDSLSAWNAMGINRLSIGIQAFQDDLLSKWNRSHSSLQAKEAITMSQNAGFENITADLIYGGPELTDDDWIENIHTIIDRGIPHISCYALTVETGTALAYQIATGKTLSPDDDQSNQQYTILQLMLKKAGFIQYEVSNFSHPGKESRHNTSYWSGIHYLGLGPAAHSFNGVSRQWNIANNIKYIHSIEEGVLPFEIEMLTDIQRYNELVMTGIRTSHGIDAGKIRHLGEAFSNYLDQQILTFVDMNDSGIGSPGIKRTGSIPEGRFIKNEFGNWALKPEYYFFADGIASDLFYING